MPIETRIDSAAGLRTHIVSGEMDFDALSSTLEGVYSDPDFLPDLNVLWDLRDAILTVFSSGDVSRVVDVVKGNWTGARAALVVGRDADFGMARMYELQHDTSSSGEVRVFRDFEEATAWVMEK
jgi:hypothetical protein